MKYLVLTAALVFTLSGYTANASFDDFESLYQGVIENCPYECDGKDFTSEFFYEADQTFKSLPADTLAALSAVAEKQANIWGDTIYEGPYMANDDVELTSIEGIYYRGQLVLYRISYAQSAWATETCDVNWEEDEPSFEECEEGVIQETSLVSLDFKRYEIEGDKYADYND